MKPDGGDVVRFVGDVRTGFRDGELLRVLDNSHDTYIVERLDGGCRWYVKSWFVEPVKTKGKIL